MSRKQETQVLVVGAGPVGLATALSLAARGVAVEVIDQEPGPGRNNYSLALHPSSLALLDDLGVTAELWSDGVRVDSVGFYDREVRRAKVWLDGLHGEFPYLLVVPRATLEAALQRRLAERHVPVRWNHRLAALDDGPAGVVATVEQLGMDSGGYAIMRPMHVVEKERRIAARYVIGADGFHSTVRRRADIALAPTGAPSAYASVELRTDMDLGGEARVVLDGDTTSVLWPQRGGRCRWAFELDGGDVPADDGASSFVGDRTWPDVDRALIDRLLRTRAPWFEGRDVTWSAHVRFEPALTRRFGVGHAWLVGDAAHVAGPAGVRSMNAGFVEAHDLASRIGRVLGAGGDGELLEQYHDERTIAWRRLLGLDGAALPTASTDAWIAANAHRIAPCMPGGADDLVRLGKQLGLEVAAGA